MKIFSWNVNSLRSCESSFINFLTEYRPDMVAIQELRAHEDQISFFLKNIDGYKYLFNDSGRPGYAGTALYYKESLPVSNITRTLGNQILDNEGRVIYLKLGDIHFFNFYTPNGNSSPERLAYKLQYYSEILKHIEALVKNNEKVVIGGDLNVGHTHLDLYLKNCHNSGFLPEERDWFTKVLNLGFFDSFRHFHKEGGYYSWWHMRDPKREQNKGWRFDYFLVSNNLKEQTKAAGIEKEVYGSDHCPVWVEIG